MSREFTIKDPKLATATIHYAEELNEEQFAAVSSSFGRSLVIAGAGSGKTRTLTYRVAWLLAQGVAPWQILLLTFTNKAAKEMLERVGALVGNDISGIWGGTFHSIANRILRRNAALLGFTASFSIMDTEDRKALIRNVVKTLKIDTTVQQFPKTDLLSAIFSLSQNLQHSVEQIVHNQHPHLARHLEAILQIEKSYTQRKKESNAMDFDDLLCFALQLLRDFPEVREHYSRQFQHVLVDEYQDTNALQGEMIDLLSAHHGNLMVVGDDAQSIYSWRGAQVRYIMEFRKRYPEAQFFQIETNYRSVPAILELSNAAIAANKDQFEKNLRAVRPEGMIPALIPCPDTRTEGLFVVQCIEQLIDEGMNPKDIAVLYRAHYHSLDVQMALTRAHIPHRVTSGVRFFEQAHIKDIVAFMRLTANAQDEPAFMRIALALPGVGPASAQKLWASWRTALSSEALYADQLLSIKAPAKAGLQWKRITEVLEEIETLAPAEMIRSILEGYYQEFLSESFENYESRSQDIEQLSVAAGQFSELDEFLTQMALLTNTDDEDDVSKPPLTLSTIHQAKGLEWKCVFVIGLCEGMFPHQRALDSGDLTQLEEERRLFYVAITRAEDQLYLSYPQYNPRSYSSYYQAPSRFLSDLPTELLETVKLQMS